MNEKQKPVDLFAVYGDPGSGKTVAFQERLLEDFSEFLVRSEAKIVPQEERPTGIHPQHGSSDQILFG